METKPIAPDRLLLRPFQIFDENWFLLTCGDFSTGDFNTMTVSWGSFGTIWNKPFAQVVVRPTRYTYTFMERYETFTLCTFPASFQDDLSLLGTKSGRDEDKIAETSLTPVASSIVRSPSFKEAILVIECRTIFYEDMDPSTFLDESIDRHYPEKDYHRMYFGEIMSVRGDPKFLAD